MDRPIPAAYYVYALRSKAGGARPYVGSTPHPPRRIAQHNGLIAGGASKTAGKARPWDMMFVVAGFTSKLAALQFEWALGNYHLTNFIPTDARLVYPVLVTKVKKGKKTSKLDMPRGQKPKNLFENLHLLLRVSGFSRWPLTVQFLRKDSFSEWQKVTSDINPPLDPERSVFLSPFCETETPTEDETTRDGVQKPQGQLKSNKIPLPIRNLNLTYDPLKPQIQKSTERLQSGEQLQCQICRDSMDASQHHILFCPQHHCDMVSHLTCLSHHLLSTEGDGNELVPTTGKCPSCDENISWSDMVRDLSLRLRGAKEISKILEKFKRKNKAAAACVNAEQQKTEGDLDSLNPMQLDNDDEDVVLAEGQDILDDQADFEDIDMVSDHSDDAYELPKLKPDSPSRSRPAPAFSNAKIIPDSEWDDIEQISD